MIRQYIFTKQSPEVHLPDRAVVNYAIFKKIFSTDLYSKCSRLHKTTAKTSKIYSKIQDISGNHLNVLIFIFSLFFIKQFGDKNFFRPNSGTVRKLNNILYLVQMKHRKRV